jgi:hypothetical protein
VIGNGPLLDLLEPAWRRQLTAGAAVPAGLDVEPELVWATAAALGEQARLLSVGEVAGRWPGCVVVALARVAAAGGSLWPAWHRMARARATRQSADEWGQAFLSALGTLGIMPPGLQETEPRAAVGAYLAAAPAPAGNGDADGEGGSGGTAPPGTRLDPFGVGVLLITQPPPGGEPAERPALPEEAADPGDPLLVFDENGEPAGKVLPADVVWALHPADGELRSDVPPRVIVAGRPPLTWRGWRLVQLDLRGASWLGLDGGGRRTVRGRTKPVLRTGLPVPGVTAAGRLVYAGPPEVLLPPGPGTWRVEARRAGSGAVLARATASGDAWQPGSLWRKAPRPLLGELVIIATGPTDTAGLRRTVVVAEAVSVTSYPAPRLTSPGGLEPAEVVIAAPPGMTVSPSALRFPEDAATREVTCVAGQVVLRIAVTPPHIRMRIDPEPGSGGDPTPWHDTGPLRLTLADLWRGGALRIDLPGAAALPPITLTSVGGGPGTGTGPAQILAPTGQGRYPLRRILDTVTANGDLDLAITAGTRTVTIASVTGSAQAADPWAIG